MCGGSSSLLPLLVLLLLLLRLPSTEALPVGAAPWTDEALRDLRTGYYKYDTASSTPPAGAWVDGVVWKVGPKVDAFLSPQSGQTLAWSPAAMGPRCQTVLDDATDNFNCFSTVGTYKYTMQVPRVELGAAVYVKQNDVWSTPDNVVTWTPLKNCMSGTAANYCHCANRGVLVGWKKEACSDVSCLITYACTTVGEHDHVNQRWLSTPIDKAAEWVLCPPGQMLVGFRRMANKDCTGLDCLAYISCVANEGDNIETVFFGEVDEDVTDFFRQGSTLGEKVIPADYVMLGYRQAPGCNRAQGLSCITHIRRARKLTRLSVDTDVPPTAVPPAPTDMPTPTPVPDTDVPTDVPTSVPTDVPTDVPTSVPTDVPTAVPTSVPTDVPTDVPTSVPTSVPTDVPTSVPTSVPTAVPTSVPTDIPTSVPTSMPTDVPTDAPTSVPTPVPTSVPTDVPTTVPTSVPTDVPTSVPTAVPTSIPTSIPTAVPTSVPTDAPTDVPTSVPTAAPTVPTDVATPVPGTGVAGATGVPGAASPAPVAGELSPLARRTAWAKAPTTASERVIEAGGATVAVAAAISGGAGGATRLAIATIGCHLEGEAQKRLPLIMHPTQLTILDSHTVGAVVGNTLVIVGFGILCTAVLTVLRAMPNDTLFRIFKVVDAQGFLRLPAAPFFVFKLLYQGTSYAALSILVNESRPGVLLIGIVSTAACVVVPVLVLQKVRIGVPMYARYEVDPTTKGRLKRWLIGPGEWVSLYRTREWANRYSTVVREYRQEYAWFGTVEFGLAFVLSALMAVKATNLVLCGHLKLVMCGVFVLIMLGEAVMWPHAHAADSLLDFVASGIEAGAMMLMGIDYYEGHWPADETSVFRSAEYLMLAAAVVVILRLASCIVAELYIICSGRRDRLEEAAYLDACETESVGTSAGPGVATLPLEYAGFYNESLCTQPLQPPLPPSVPGVAAAVVPESPTHSPTYEARHSSSFAHVQRGRTPSAISQGLSNGTFAYAPSRSVAGGGVPTTPLAGHATPPSSPNSSIHGNQPRPRLSVLSFSSRQSAPASPTGAIAAARGRGLRACLSNPNENSFASFSSLRSGGAPQPPSTPTATATPTSTTVLQT